MGINEHSIVSWEAGKQPHVRMYPGILAFLGFEPRLEPDTSPERLLAERRRRGLSIKRAAKLVGVDEGTWGRWEQGRQASCPDHHALIAAFLGHQNDNLTS